MRQDAPNREACTPQRRADYTPQDVPVARRKTCRLYAGRRAGCTLQDVSFSRRKTCQLHVARHAGCTPEDVPVARRKTCRFMALDLRGLRRILSHPMKRNFTQVTCRVQKPDVPRTCQIGAHGGAAGRGRAGLGAYKSFRPGDKRPVIERKCRPTGKISQQPNQSPNRQVQKANTSHAAEACRMRAGRRASRVPGDTPFCAPGDTPFCAPGDAPFCAPRDALVLRAGRRAVLRAERRAGSARRETRWFCAPGDALVLRAACARGRRAGCVPCARARPVRFFSAEAGVASELL